MANESEALTRLEARMDEQIASLHKSRTITIVAVGILLVFLTVYLTVLTGQVESLTKPEDVSMMATDAIRNKIPEIRRVVAKEIKTQAPQMLDKAVDDFIAQVPQARQDLKGRVDDLVTEQMKEIHGQIDANFDEALATHGDEIRGLVKELGTPEGAQRFQDYVYETLSEQLKNPALASDVHGYGLFLVRLSKRLDELFTAEDLHGAQRLEKEFITALREISNRTPKYEKKDGEKVLTDEIIKGTEGLGTPAPAAKK